MKDHVTLVALAIFISLLPLTPGCFCVENDPVGPLNSISREYEGYLVIDRTGESTLFAISGLWIRPDGIVEADIVIPGETPGMYPLDEIQLGGGELTFSVTIPLFSDQPLDFRTSFNDRFLVGTFTEQTETDSGRLIAVANAGLTQSETDMIGAYELITVSTDGDTILADDENGLSVRLEFHTDGSFDAVSRLQPEGLDTVDAGHYSLTDGFLTIALEDSQVGIRLPVSIRGFIVNRDLMIISSPRPFPSFDSLVPVENGIQIEHFRQVI